MTSDSSSSQPDPETPLLSNLKSPDDLKSLDDGQLDQLAGEIRETLIRTLSRTGGHLGPNLGVVELTIALHRIFETPSDKFVMDVSHQGYVHKMLTGRGDRIESIRQYEGLNFGDNVPYSGRLKNDCLYRHATQNGLAHALIELRQDEIAQPQGVELWGTRLVTLLQRAAGDCEMVVRRDYGSWCDA